jgi:hypothetical protein
VLLTDLIQVRRRPTDELRAETRLNTSVNQTEQLNTTVRIVPTARRLLARQRIIADKLFNQSAGAELGSIPLATEQDAQPSSQVDTEGLSTSLRRRVSLSAERGPRIAESSSRLKRSIADSPTGLSLSVFKQTRSRRILRRTVFFNSVIQLVAKSNADYEEDEESSSIGAPTPPFETITIYEAMKEDAPK